MRFFDVDGHEICFEEWMQLFEVDGERRVSLTQRNEFWISTVFMGLEANWEREPPLIYETMIFCEGEWNHTCWRWATEAEAIAGHVMAVTLTELEMELKT